jgi:hypothetical protein
MKKILFLLFSSLFFVTSTKAQMVGQESSYLAAYKKKLPYFQELITGGQYVEAPKTIEGHPFYFLRQFDNGNLSINGIIYPEVPLMYDCYRDQVITFHPIYNQRILINPDKIDEFSLSNGEVFRFMEGNSSYVHHLNGLYQVLNDGSTQILVKRFKTTKSKREMSIYTDEFIEKRDFFIWNSGVFTPINKANQAIEILELDPKIAKKHLKDQKLRFQENTEDYLIALVNLSKRSSIHSSQ